MSNPNPAQPARHPAPQQRSLHPSAESTGRTALVSMFPLHIETPPIPARPVHRPTTNHDSLHAGK